MTEILTAQQMRAIEREAVESGRASGGALMERAGAAVVDAVMRQWPELDAAPGRTAVLCGPGNNGGDGFVIARLLADRGWRPVAFLLGDPERLPADARANFERWRELGDTVEARHHDVGVEEAIRGADLVVDALFGTGLRRPFLGPAGNFGFLRDRAPWSAAGGGPRVVAVDVPSGLCSDSGRVLGAPDAQALHVRADLTVALHRLKGAHVLLDASIAPDGAGHPCGKIVVAQIGLDAAAGAGAALTLVGRPDFARLRKRAAAHKYDHGHALVLSGGAGSTGAARLAARGALRIGAGLVTLGVPGSAQQEAACQITAVMLRRVDGANDLAQALADPRISAVCLGPGLGFARAAELAPAALARPDSRRTVLDADALGAFADSPQALFGMLHEDCALTPHMGEFARLFPDIAERLAAPAEAGPAFSRADAARQAAARAGCVALLKGPDTVIAAPDGRCAVCASFGESAAPWLATAGAGDVLAGFVAGLAARGWDLFEAAGTAAWLHAQCARRFGPGLVAEDIAETLPAVLADLERGEAQG